MTIIGIGTDIVQISRIEGALARHGQRFIERILHTNELATYQQRKQSVSYLAKRFAAKEAVSKALGTGIAKQVSLTEIETHNDKMGKPMITYHGQTREYVASLNIQQSFLSLSDEKEYAIAYVILTGENTSTAIPD